ncbi:hypothetical protein AQJ91_43680 [Streptomyces dysideae]|uniref:Fibronectin type-III domain-containing protein n=1 Tax=Streptomyces dysideae TaxID=909626 RepID=A0A101UQJ9_9ACTN|nr:hypothetical protein AQJ91_43680 [Streptomyces dysideae]
MLLSVAEPGPDPFTDSTATAPARLPAPADSPTPGERPPAKPADHRSAKGSDAGLYGGTRGTDSCDVEKQIRLLEGNKATEQAFAEAMGMGVPLLPAYLRSLTSVVLRKDTRVTGYGLVDGKAKSFPAVLQSGTAVLIDDLGVPRVRCAGGNPLTPAEPLKGAARHTGRAWHGYGPKRAVVVGPAPRPLTEVFLVDEGKSTWIERPVGKNGRGNRGGKNKDKVIPAPPAGLEGQATATSTVELAWEPPKGDVEIAGYQIFQEDVAKPVQELTPDSREARISNLKPGTEYSFTVRAVDEAGNISVPSNEVEVLTNYDTETGQPDPSQQQPDQSDQPDQPDQSDPNQQQPDQSDQPDQPDQSDPNQQQPDQTDQPTPDQQQPTDQPDQQDPNQQPDQPDQPDPNQQQPDQPDQPQNNQ